MKLNRNTNMHLSSLAAAAACASIFAACSPVTPSMDKISSYKPPTSPMSERHIIRVVTVDHLDADSAKVAAEKPDAVRITLSAADESSEAHFTEFKEQGKTTLTFEGEIQDFGYHALFETTTATNKKDLADQAQFKLGHAVKPSDDKKTWTLTLEDNSPDLDAGKRARAHLVKLSFIFPSAVKNVTPELPPAPETSPVPVDAPPVVQ